MALDIGGYFTVTIKDSDGNIVEKFKEHNLVPKTGLNYMLNCSTGAGTPVSAITVWYVGLLGNIAINADSTLSNVAGSEVVGYGETTRPRWTLNALSVAGLVSNSASPAVFTASSTISVYGIFVASTATKQSSTGQLLSALNFAVRNLTTGNIIEIQYDLGISDDAL